MTAGERFYDERKNFVHPQVHMGGVFVLERVSWVHTYSGLHVAVAHGMIPGMERWLLSLMASSLVSRYNGRAG